MYSSFWALSIGLGLVGACARPGPRDLGQTRNPRSEFQGAGSAAPPVAAPANVAPATPRIEVLARASSRALATSATHVFFGDNEDDALLAVPKSGGDPVRVARRSPMREALVSDDEDLVWIASPGDVVLRLAKGASEPKVVRDRGVFTDVVAQDDVFFTEVVGRGGALLRVTGYTAASLATFDGSPRGLALTADQVYIATSNALLATPHRRGEVRVLAKGSAFSHPIVVGEALYATVALGGRRDLVRVPVRGGALETVARDVRDAPVAASRGSVLWFGGEPTALIRDGAVVATDERFAEVTALAVDGDGIFVATGHGEGGAVLKLAPP